MKINLYMKLQKVQMLPLKKAQKQVTAHLIRQLIQQRYLIYYELSHSIYFYFSPPDDVYLSNLQILQSKYEDWVKIHCFTSSLPNKMLFQRYGVTSSAIYLIRPDGYIGFRLYGHDLPLLDNYLKKLFSK